MSYGPHDQIMIDCETYSTIDLKTAGVYRYAQGMTTGVHCLAWRHVQAPLEPIQLWLPGDLAPDWGKATLIAHNAAFERIIMREILVRDHKFDPAYAEITRWRDTMIASAYWGGPLDLHTCGIAYDIAKKDMAGHKLMMRMCKPCGFDLAKGGLPIWYHEEYPEKLPELYDYCKADVKVETELWKLLPPVPQRAWDEWFADQRMNDRGVPVDLKFVANLAEIVKLEEKRLGEEFHRLTGLRVTQTKAFKEYLSHALGEEIESVNKETLTDLLADADHRGSTPALAAGIRLEAAKSSTAKLKAIQRATMTDRRIRGMFQFGGAPRTLRWAGRLAQPQNFPRPSLPKYMTKQMVKAVLTLPPEQARDAMFEFAPVPPLTVASSLLRGCFVAPAGQLLYVVDYSQIEARLIAWLAGQHDVLDLFRRGEDVYQYTADTKIRGGATRQLGKTAVLSAGYGLGPPKFVKICKLQGIKIDEARAKEVVRGWREGNPKIVQLWKDLENAFRQCCYGGGTKIEIKVGEHLKVKRGFDRRGTPLIGIELPSGRSLIYREPHVHVGKWPDGEPKYSPAYMGVDPVTKKWGRLTTFGGELTGHVTQATARELMANLLGRIDALEQTTQLSLVGTVHDEAICLGPATGAGARMDALLHLATMPTKWSHGLPLAADGFFADRYGK